VSKLAALVKAISYDIGFLTFDPRPGTVDDLGLQVAKPTRRPLAILLPNTMKMNRLLIGLLTAGLAFSSNRVVAQTPPAAAPAKKAEPTPTPASKSAETDEQATLKPAVKLEAIEVLGSRIRRTDLEGPSPVSAYDQDYIRSSGAMTLSDFLNQIPQSYAGIASGRGSSPDEFNPEFGQRTETTSPPFNFVVGAADSPPAQTGVSGANLRGLGSGSTLVLVDGRRTAQSGNGNRSTDTRQGFVDLNTIPIGMIERVEVITDGASAIYGADAVGGVINIILKKNYSGSEISSGYKATEHGGGRERNVSIVSGFTYGKLSGTVTVNYFDRQSLKASDRAFSKEQNQSNRVSGTLTPSGAPRYGIDYRFNWGYPAVVQAAGGTVAGNFDAIPGVRVVLVPTGATATPSISQFIPSSTIVSPATVVNASGQRRMNTASFLDLVPEAQRTGASGNLNYRFNERISLYGNYRTSRSASRFNSQPVTSITGGFGTAVALPAAFTPFNQNVTIAMVLPEWGSTAQTVLTRDAAANIGVEGKLAATWRWDLGASWQRQTMLQTNRIFNGAGFAGLLTNPDANLRFNPFIDAGAPGAPSQAAKLETLSLYPKINSATKNTGIDFTADGDVIDLPGGTAKLAAGASTNRSNVTTTSTNFSAVVVPVTTITTLLGAQTSDAVFAEAFLPAFGKTNSLPLLRRLDFQVAGRKEAIREFSKTVPKVGFSWSPVQPVLVRASWSEGFRAPGVTEYLIPPTTVTSTLTDPRRTPTTTTGIVESRGSNRVAQPELSETSFAGLIYEPTFAKGLTLQVNYYDTIQKDVFQLMTAQTIINNEALFPDRVVRAATTPSDVALNQPGQITGVNRVFVNFGRISSRSMDYVVEYVAPWEQFGRWRMNFSASRNLSFTRKIAPGQPEVVLDGDTASPPKWKYNASIFWRKGSWNASAFLWHLDGFQSNSVGSINVANSAAVTYFPTPSVSKIDLRGSYDFKNGLWRGYGKGVRVGVGISNIFDKEPPYSATVWGFNAGLHRELILGRTYELSFSIPIK
jgi:iron complex outermembrane receptor protein